MDVNLYSQLHLFANVGFCLCHHHVGCIVYLDVSTTVGVMRLCLMCMRMKAEAEEVTGEKMAATKGGIVVWLFSTE